MPIQKTTHKGNEISHCFISWSFIDGMSTPSFDEICLSLSKLGHKVTMVARENSQKCKLNKNLTVIPVEDRWPSSTKLSHIYFLLFVTKYLAKKQYDTIDVFMSPGVSFLPIILFFKKAKFVLHIRTSSIRQDIIGLLKNIIARIDTWFFDAIAILDKGIGPNLFFEKKELNKILEVPLGINPNIFAQTQNERHKLFNEVPINKKILIYVGKMDRTRKLDIMLEAFNIVLQDYKNCILVMVGGGDHVEYLKQKTLQLGIEKSVIFTGIIPYSDVPKYVASADVALSFIPMNKTYNHQPPLKSLEYLQMGIPQVATKTAAIRKYIINNHNGIIARDNPENFARAILLLLRDQNLYNHIKHHCKDGLEASYYDNIVKNILIPFYDRMVHPNS